MFYGLRIFRRNALHLSPNGDIFTDGDAAPVSQGPKRSPVWILTHIQFKTPISKRAGGASYTELAANLKHFGEQRGDTPNSIAGFKACFYEENSSGEVHWSYAEKDSCTPLRIPGQPE